MSETLSEWLPAYDVRADEVSQPHETVTAQQRLSRLAILMKRFGWCDVNYCSTRARNMRYILRNYSLAGNGESAGWEGERIYHGATLEEAIDAAWKGETENVEDR